MNKMKTVKFVDLFAGLGGIRLGFEQAFTQLGFKTNCVLTSEIKPAAIQALKENFSHENLIGDICKVNEKEIPDFDFLLAGFPCQAFSFAGKGFGFADTRGTLFFEVERILKEKKPYGFILENVEGLVLHDREKPTDKIGRTLTTILTKLENLNYKVQWKLLDCQNFGVPQIRKRIFIVGTKTGNIDLSNFPITKVNLIDILEKNKPVVNSHFTRCLLNKYNPEQLFGKSIKDKRGGHNNIHSWDIDLKGPVSYNQKVLLEKLFKERRKKHWASEIGIEWMDGMPLTESQIRSFYDVSNLHFLLEDLVEKGYLKKEFPKKISIIKPDGINEVKVRVYDESKEKGYNIVTGKLSFEFSKILDPYTQANTLVAMDVSHIGVVDKDGIRQLTIREGLRLFGYPEEYKLNMFENNSTDISKAFDLLGNTVVVPVVKAISLRLGEAFQLKNINFDGNN